MRTAPGSQPAGNFAMFDGSALVDVVQPGRDLVDLQALGLDVGRDSLGGEERLRAPRPPGQGSQTLPGLHVDPNREGRGHHLEPARPIVNVHTLTQG